MWSLVRVCAAALFFCAALPAVAADPTPEELKALFQETLAASRMTVEMSDGRLSGPGAAYLREKAREAQYVLVGEEHGVATIAEAVSALFGELNGAGYRHLAIEVDPWMTAKVEGLLRSGGTAALGAYLASDGRRLSVPFYGWSAEAALADAVVKANRESLPALWGLEQVFIGAAGVLLEDIASGAKGAEARALAAALATEAKGSFEFLAKVEIARLTALRAALGGKGDESFARLADDLILSARIYQPFTAGQGLSAYAANLERENLMKRLFMARVSEAETRGKSPKVLFKFGANHLMRGLSTTHIPSLGNFVADYALAHGQQTFHLLVMCGPNSKASDFSGNDAVCGLDPIPDLAPHIDAKKPTLFDLKPWKDKSRRWAHLPQDVKDLVWAYDAVLFVPNGTPARRLD